MRVNINNLTIQADLRNKSLEATLEMIDAINELMRERFPDEQPQIMSSGVEDSDIEEQGYDEGNDFSAERIEQLERIASYIRKNEGQIILSERGEQMRVENGQEIVALFDDHCTDNDDNEYNYKSLSEDDFHDLVQLIESLEADDEKTEKRISD